MPTNYPFSTMKSLIIDLVTCYLIILCPFINFLYYIDYGILHEELFILFVFHLVISVVLSVIIHNRADNLRCVVLSLPLVVIIDIQFDFFYWSAVGVAASLIATFIVLWIFRKHSAVILLATFATVNVSTLFVGSEPLPDRHSTNSEEDGRQDGGLPTLVHIILDEHVGIEGIPTNVPNGLKTRNDLMALFDDFGFYVFGAAHTHTNRPRV